MSDGNFPSGARLRRRKISRTNANLLLALNQKSEAQSARRGRTCTAMAAFLTAQNPVWRTLLQLQDADGTLLVPIALFCSQESTESEDGCQVLHLCDEDRLQSRQRDQKSGLALGVKEQRGRTRRKELIETVCTVDELEICAAVEWGIVREAACWPRSRTCDVFCGALTLRNDRIADEVQAYSIARSAARLHASVLVIDCGERRAPHENHRYAALETTLGNITHALSQCGYRGSSATVFCSKTDRNAILWRHVYIAVRIDNEEACEALFCFEMERKQCMSEFLSSVVWKAALS